MAQWCEKTLYIFKLTKTLLEKSDCLFCFGMTQHEGAESLQPGIFRHTEFSVYKMYNFW